MISKIESEFDEFWGKEKTTTCGEREKINIKQFYRGKIIEMLEELKMEDPGHHEFHFCKLCKYTTCTCEHHQAVQEINDKINKLNK